MKLSVVIPCANYEQFIGAAIDSVLANTRAPDEVIVIDDGSTDRSAEVIGRFEGVTMISKPNGGMASAINVGVAAATGDVVVLLDADDTMSPDRLEWVERAFADPLVDLAWHRLTIVGPSGNETGVIPAGELPSGDVAPLIADGRILGFPVASAIAFRRTVIERTGPIPEDDFKNTAEAFLVRTVPFIGQVAASQHSLGIYRVHDASVSRRVQSRTVEGTAGLLQRRIVMADSEHRLVARNADHAGLPTSVARLEGRDRSYLELWLAHARLSAPTRAQVLRDVRAFIDGDDRPDLARRVWFRSKAVAYTAASRSMVASLFRIKLGVSSPSGLARFTERLYWRLVRVRQIPSGWQVRRSHAWAVR